MKKKETGKERFERYKKILLKIIKKILLEHKVYLFGSRARFAYGQGSDKEIVYVKNGFDSGWGWIYWLAHFLSHE